MPGIVGDGDRTGQIFQRHLAQHHLCHHLQADKGSLPGFAQGFLQGAQGRITDFGQHGVKHRAVDLRRGADAANGCIVFFDPVGRDDQPLQPPCALDFYLQSLLRMGAHHLDPVAPERHRRTLDAHDAITLAQAAPLPRAVGHQFADNRINRRLIRIQAEFGHEITVQIGCRQIAQMQNAQGFPAGCRTDFELRLLRLLPLQHQIEQAPARILPTRHRHAVDGKYRVLFPQLCHRRRGVRPDLAHHRLDARHAINEQRPVQQHRQQQIGDRPGHHDRHAPQHRLAVERARQIRCGHLALALVQHLDVATQRNGRKSPFRFAVAKTFAIQHATETDRKTQHLDPAAACDEVVSQFVEHHQHGNRHDESEQRCHIQKCPNFKPRGTQRPQRESPVPL